MEMDHQIADGRGILLWVSWSRWSEKVPRSPATDSRKHKADVDRIRMNPTGKWES